MGRNWKSYPKRFAQQANLTSGSAALAGFGISGIGVLVATPVVTALGGALFIAVGGWCAVKAFPPATRRPEESVGVIIHDLSALALIDPPPKRVGVLGPTRVGKTTLLAHLQMRVAPNERTERPYACVVAVPGGSPTLYIAVVDAAGQQYSQQFRVFDEVDAVIILLDHNSSDIDGRVLQARLAKHEEFLEQMSHHRLSRANDPARVYFLLNKRDLWEADSDAPAIEEWFDRRIKDWSANSRSTVSSAKHSNRNMGDLAKVADVLRNWAAS